MKYDSHEQMDCDLAEDELNRILTLKRDVIALFDGMRRITSAIEVDELEGTFEQEFDDVLHRDWYRLTRISSSVEFTQEIPSLESLRATAAVIKQNLSASEALLPLPNLAARGMPRPSTLVRLNDTALFGEEAV